MSLLPRFSLIFALGIVGAECDPQPVEPAALGGEIGDIEEDRASAVVAQGSRRRDQRQDRRTHHRARRARRRATRAVLGTVGLERLVRPWRNRGCIRESGLRRRSAGDCADRAEAGWLRRRPGSRGASRPARELRSTPDIESVAEASVLPFGDYSFRAAVQREGPRLKNEDPKAAGQLLYVHTYTVMSDYFKTLGLTMVQGREFTAAEEAAVDGTTPVIIDVTLAEGLFANENPVGRLLQYGADSGTADG